MTSFILISENKNKRQEYLHDLCLKEGIDLLDITTIEKQLNLQSIGIESIKNFQKKVYLKPIKSLNKIVVIEEAHLLTLEAQNSLLKILEEPPEHTLLALSLDSKEDLLPTIISRCQIIELPREKNSISEEEQNELLYFFNQVKTTKIGDLLYKAENLSQDKLKAIEWFKKAVILAREEIIKLSPSKSEEDREAVKNYMNIIELFQEAHKQLKNTNINARFLIEKTFLSL